MRLFNRKYGGLIHCIESAYVPVFKNNHFLLRSSVQDGLAHGETQLNVAEKKKKKRRGRRNPF